MRWMILLQYLHIYATIYFSYASKIHSSHLKVRLRVLRFRWFAYKPILAHNITHLSNEYDRIDYVSSNKFKKEKIKSEIFMCYSS